MSPSAGEDHQEVEGVVELGEVRACVDAAAEGTPNVPNGSSFSSSLGADPLPDIFVESKNITCEFSPLGALQSFQLRRCGLWIGAIKMGEKIFIVQMKQAAGVVSHDVVHTSNVTDLVICPLNPSLGHCQAE
jgi:hypothetical protein